MLVSTIEIQKAWACKRGSLMKSQKVCLFLSIASVVDFTKEVLGFIILSELLQPQSQDSPVNNKEDGQQTNVINTEPFTSSLCGNSGSAGKNCRNSSSKSGNDSSLGDGVQGHGKRSSGLTDTECCFQLQRQRKNKVSSNHHIQIQCCDTCSKIFLP